jgi:hypothetical protein
MEERFIQGFCGEPERPIRGPGQEEDNKVNMYLQEVGWVHGLD